MKKSLLLLILPLLLSLHFSSCEKLTCYKVKGPITQWDYSIAHFNRIRVFNAPQIYITQGDSQSVVVESEENMFKALQFHIQPVEERLLMDFSEVCVKDIGHFKIFITVDTLKELDLRDGGEVFVEDTMFTDELTVFVEGSAKVDISKLSAQSVNTNISGSGSVSYAGTDTVQTQIITVSGSGSVSSFGLVTKNVTATISGSGSIETTATELLNVNISGSGNVSYKGAPLIDAQVSGPGSVIDAN